MLKALIFPGQLNMGVKDVDGTPTSQFGSPDDVSPEEFAKATREHWQWWERGDVDFQIKSGGTSYGERHRRRIMTKPAMSGRLHTRSSMTQHLPEQPERSNLVCAVGPRD
jgi:hypothetical protein